MTKKVITHEMYVKCMYGARLARRAPTYISGGCSIYGMRPMKTFVSFNRS